MECCLHGGVSAVSRDKHKKIISDNNIFHEDNSTDERETVGGMMRAHIINQLMK